MSQNDGQKSRGDTERVVAEALRRHDLSVVSEALDALLEKRRAELLAWARSYVIVGGVAFAGTLEQLTLLHAHTGIARVGTHLAFERSIAATRKRLGAR